MTFTNYKELYLCAEWAVRKPQSNKMTQHRSHNRGLRPQLWLLPNSDIFIEALI